MWLYLLWWLVICNGNTALSVAIINRVHGCRLPEWAIHLSHKIHYLHIVSVPIFTVIATGWYGPGLLRGGTWSALPTEWSLAFAVCAASSLVFWGSVIRRHLRITPTQVLHIQTQRRNIAEELGTPPHGAGPYSWMTRWPGNEIFQLEVVERELLIPRLPPAWDGVSILHFTDAHFIGTVTSISGTARELFESQFFRRYGERRCLCRCNRRRSR